MDKENNVTPALPPDNAPIWYEGKRINEVLFCQQFLEKHPKRKAIAMTIYHRYR